MRRSPADWLSNRGSSRGLRQKIRGDPRYLLLASFRLRALVKVMIAGMSRPYPPCAPARATEQTTHMPPIRSNHADLEACLLRDLRFQVVERRARILLDAAAVKTGEVDVVAPALHFVIVLLAL